MNNITDKIAYTARAIDDIQAALEEHGIDMDGVALILYGNIIRTIRTDDNYIDEQGFAHSPMKILDHVICSDFPVFNITGNIRFSNIMLTRNDSTFIRDINKMTIEHPINKHVLLDYTNEIKNNLIIQSSFVSENDAVIFQESDLVIKEGE